MRKIVPSHTELPIKNQHHATHTAAEKLLARSNRHSVQLPVEHKLQPVGAASGATSASRPQALTEVPIRAEPLARCDRTRHWIKAATRLLFAVRLRGPRSPLSPHDLAKLKQHLWGPSCLGFCDAANQEDQWLS